MGSPWMQWQLEVANVARMRTYQTPLVGKQIGLEALIFVNGAFPNEVLIAVYQL